MDPAGAASELHPAAAGGSRGVSVIIVAAIGAFVVAIAFVGLVQPGALIRFVKHAWATRRGLQLAVGFRLVFGIALLLAAADSKAPLTLTVLGCVSFVSAAMIPVLGYTRALAFIDWWTQRPPGFIRAWSLVACAFGAFLVYAVA
jgi:hypothetical protein